LSVRLYADLTFFRVISNAARTHIRTLSTSDAGPSIYTSDFTGRPRDRGNLRPRATRNR